jgi:hypothetical protein
MLLLLLAAAVTAFAGDIERSDVFTGFPVS